MYVGIKFEAKLKKEFIELINRLHEINLGPSCPNYWKKLHEDYPKYDFIWEWSEVDGCNFIPFGAIHNIPWRYEICSQLNNNIWKVYCSVRNPNNISIFISKVLRKMIIEPVSITLRKEGWKVDKELEIQPV